MALISSRTVSCLSIQNPKSEVLVPVFDFVVCFRVLDIVELVSLLDANLPYLLITSMPWFDRKVQGASMNSEH